MSFKFGIKGDPFPVEAHNGNLVIHIGDEELRIPFGFIKEDYPYTFSTYGESNIICYLENDTSTLVMRSDGTVTKYNKDNIIMGFGKFNMNAIRDKVIYLPVGYFQSREGEIEQESYLRKMSIYGLKDTPSKWVLTIYDTPMLFYFDPMENKEFSFDVLQGTRSFPGIIMEPDGTLRETSGRYTLKCQCVKPTGKLDI